MAKKTARRSQESSLDDFLRNGTPVRGFNNLPTGTYDGHIKAGSALLEEKENGGKRVTMFLVVDSGDFKDREQRKRDDLTSEFGVNLFLGDLEAMELAVPTTTREFADVLAETDNLKVKFWVGKPSDEYPPKVRINELLEGSSKSETKDESPEPASDTPTKKEIRQLGKDEDEEGLQKIIDDEALDIDQDTFDTYPEVSKKIIEELDL